MKIEIVGASAGTGTTYRVSHAIAAALAPGSNERAQVEGLVCVTFTTKAAAELASRVRQVLVEAGHYAVARRLPLAYVGTVHSVCQRLLADHAFEAGLPPKLEVLPEAEARRLFDACFEEALGPEGYDEIEAVARRLQVNLSDAGDPDWTKDLKAVLEAARGNAMGAAALRAMAEPCADELLACFPLVDPDGAALDRSLWDAVHRLLAHLENHPDGQKGSGDVEEHLRWLERRQATSPSRLPWSIWPKLSGLKPGKTHKVEMGLLAEAASAHDRHPDLHADIRRYIALVFDAAAAGLDAYARWKAERRIVDFVDMEERTLALLRRPEVAERLAERVDLVVVDEFQDTSPIQLAIFAELAKVAKRSLWVGDRKQSIYGFRGADPSLMGAMVEELVRGGAPPEHLQHNWRSRPALVEAAAAVFVPSFGALGFGCDEVASQPKRADASLASLPPLGCMWLRGKNVGEDALALAAGIERLLAHPEATPVHDRETGEVHPLRAEDIAILIRTNGEATALEERGIHAARPQSGLVATPEGTLVLAALRLVLAPRDRLAEAELEALLGRDGRSSAEWLARELRARTDEQPALPAGPAALTPERCRALATARTMLSPSEAFERVLAALDAPGITARWASSAERVANLDALRCLVVAYEARCRVAHQPATLIGLLAYFDEAAGSDPATDAQHQPTRGAVQLSTYHGAKGLEWPVVVLASLENHREGDAWGVAVEPRAGGFDLSDPLAGRSVRLWPWPYGAMRKVPVTDAVARTEVASAARSREAAESLRLLYVGWTRARDHLVLAARLDAKGSPKVAWLEQLADVNGPVLELPTGTDELGTITIRGARFPARVWHVQPDAPSTTTPAAESRWFARPDEAVAKRAPYRIHPASAKDDWPGLPTARVVAVERRGDPTTFSLGDAPADEVGTVVHAFLAADRHDAPPAAREAMARSLLVGAGLAGAVRPAEIVRASDELRAWVERRWPDAVWHREAPVHAIVGPSESARRVDGSIDLLLETAVGWVVVDHKSFGGEAKWESKALDFGPQLAAYGACVRAAGRAPVGYFIHFALAGGIVEVAFDDA